MEEKNRVPASPIRMKRAAKILAGGNIEIVLMHLKQEGIKFSTYLKFSQIFNKVERKSLVRHSTNESWFNHKGHT